jgi:hypothetical protein
MAKEETLEKKHSNSLHVYALLTTNKPNDFDLQLCSVDGGKKFIFKNIANLQTEISTDVHLPYLYYLELPNGVDEHTQILTSYSLRISAAGTLTSWHYHEDVEIKQRYWFDVKEVKHQFLFSVDFQRGALGTKPPCNGVLNWDQLWQYTYFLIQQNNVRLFDLFIDQFSIKHNDFEQQQPNIDSFFRQCFMFLPTIRKALDDDVNVNIILVRMIGLLNTSNQRSLQNHHSISYIDILLQSILNKIELFFNLINNDWWLLVKDGLTILLCFKLQSHSTVQNNDSITFINSIPHINRYQEQIADSVAKKITSSNIKPTQPNWLDLFKMTTDDTLILECLQLTNTFTEYMIYAERLLNSKTIPDVKDKISDNLQIMLDKNHFQITLENIQLLLHALQTNCTDNLRSVLQQSQSLSSCIANYMNSVVITDKNQLNLIYQILNLYYNPYLLHYISKTTIITNTLTRHNFTTSNLLSAFYIEWFNCFLCDPRYTNSNEETKNFRYFIDIWLKQFTPHLRPYVELIKLLDKLVPMLEKSEKKDNNRSERLDIFLEKIFRDYTEKETDLIKRVNGIATNVQNEKALKAFKLHFKNTIVQSYLALMKIMDTRSPLYLLLQNTRKSPNIKLTVELMEICTDAIKLNDNDIYSDAIEKPNENSFISTILFNPYFNKLNIHQAAVNQLKDFLKRKKEIGLQLEDLNRTRNFSRNQNEHFRKIWKYVQQFCGQQPSMETLLYTAHKQLEEKSSIKEKIQLCLTTYCKNATDIEQYQLEIDQLAHQLTNSAIKFIQIPDKISQLVPFADVLNPYNTCKTWLNFWQNEQNNLNISKFHKIFLSCKSNCQMSRFMIVLSLSGSINNDGFVEILLLNYPFSSSSRRISICSHKNFSISIQSRENCK